MRKQAIFNSLFWIVSFAILYNLYTQDYKNGFLDFAYTLLLHVPLAYAFYSGCVLANRHLINTKYVVFVIASILNIAISVFLHYFAYNILSDLLFPNHFIVTFFTLYEIIAFNLLYFFFGTLITMTFNWFSLKDRQLAIEKEKNDIQMQTLKSQINPHFLFNSLNNIYSFLPKREGKAKDYLMRLSDSLRYMIYETDEELVPLSDELEYIHNYIELEKLRLEDHQIDISVEGESEGLLIAPLILIPIIENCFKHIDKERPKVSIGINIDQNIFQLRTANSKGENIEEGGIGMKNLISRLRLLYPNRHDFSVEKDNLEYRTSLILNLLP